MAIGDGALSRGTCIVTGGNGFLGRHLCVELARRGWSVRALVRNLDRDPFRHPEIATFECDLPDVVDEEAFDGADVVIHCAYMNRHTTLEEAKRVNEGGSARVLALARQHDAHFVFISSTGAHPEALSYYGRSKLAIEETLDLSRDLVIRPGLILGDGGLFQRISESLDRFGIIPVFDGGHQEIQGVHVEDLAGVIASAIERGLAGRFVVADPEPIELRALFSAMADRMGTSCRLVPLPARPTLAILRMFERLGLRLPLSSENVLGALSLRPQPSQDDLQFLGSPVRSTMESLDALIEGASHD